MSDMAIFCLTAWTSDELGDHSSSEGARCLTVKWEEAVHPVTSRPEARLIQGLTMRPVRWTPHKVCRQ